MLQLLDDVSSHVEHDVRPCNFKIMKGQKASHNQY